MAIFKKIENDELYLYMNGNLIYKRWLKTGQSKVFDVMAYDKYTLTSIKDLDYENPRDLVIVKANLKLKRTEDETQGLSTVIDQIMYLNIEKTDNLSRHLSGTLSLRDKTR